MLKKIIVLSFLAPLAFSAVACSTESAREELGSTDQAVCANPDGVDAVLAALAVATAKEMKRWDANDFTVINYRSVGISALGLAACGGACPNVQALLDLQLPAANGQIKFTDGTTLNSASYTSKLTSYLKRQLTCEAQPDNHAADNCPAEAHRLVWESQVPGSCDKDDWFAVYKADCATNDATCKLAAASQLKNKLGMFGAPNNAWLAFQLNTDGTKVGIDPTSGLTDPGTGTTGACLAVCQKFSMTSLIGECCSCNGVAGTMARAIFNVNTYQCK